MSFPVAPDSILVELFGQGSEPRCRIRLNLPDGSQHVGDLDSTALFDQIHHITLQQPSSEVIRQTWGQMLFHALFPGRLGGEFLSAIRAAGQRGIRLRLQIDPNLPQLQRVPWERLAYPQGEEWLAVVTSPKVLFSRLSATSNPWGLPVDSGALRMLVVIASPFPENHPLYVNPVTEQNNLLNSLTGLKDQLDIEVLSGTVSLPQIAQKLAQGNFTLLHYIGHGEWREAENQAYLLLTTTYPDGTLGPGGVSAAEIHSALQSLPVKPALVFLAACESARSSSLDAFSSIADQFVRNGCPAVVSMLEKVETGLLRTFAHDFYQTLASSGCVDYAVNRARLGLLDNPYFQWAVPILYMNLPDGALFDAAQRFRPAQRRPYKFLSPYRLEDSDLFKGRAEEIRAVENSIRQFPLTVVYGASGVGMTSLLEAGVMPRLQQDNWLAIRISAYDNLSDQFRQNFHPVWRVGGSLVVRGDAPLDEVLLALDPQRFPKILLVLDQFEQTRALGEDSFTQLQEELQRSQDRLGGRLRIAILIHEDALNRLTTLQHWFDGRSGKWIYLSPLNRNQALEAIIEPLDVLNWPVTLNRELADRYIVTDLSANYPTSTRDNPEEDGKPASQWVDPGQLQIACTWLYDQARLKRPPVIDEKLYLEEAGGVDGILVRYLEEELLTRFADRSSIVKNILVAMASPEMSHWVPPGDILSSPLFSGFQNNAPQFDENTLISFMDELVRAELLTRQSRDGSVKYAFSSHTIADEARRLGAEKIQQAYAAGDELERIWRIWLAYQLRTRSVSKDPDASLATREQYELLSKSASSLDARPIKYLLMLRSAARHQIDPQPWVHVLKTSNAGIRLLQHVDQPLAYTASPQVPPSALDLAARMLGTHTVDMATRPVSEIGRLAWTAAHSSNPTDRSTSAFALAILAADEEDLYKRLQPALTALPSPFQRFSRRAELTAVLADSGQVTASLARQTPIQQSGAYLWRVWRRFLRNRRWVGWVAAGSGIGAALGLGLERFLVGALTESSVVANAGLGRMFFALFSYWGLILAAFTALFVALRPILTLADQPADREMHRRWSSVLMGGLGFLLANLLVALLNNLNLANAPGLIPAGGLVGIALAGSLCLSQPRFSTRMLYSLISGGIFALVQVFFELLPAAGSGIAIALSSGILEVEFDYFSAAAWQTWIQATPDWAAILAVIEAGLAGFALTLGAVSGFTAASSAYQRWGKYWDLTGN